MYKQLSSYIILGVLFISLFSVVISADPWDDWKKKDFKVENSKAGFNYDFRSASKRNTADTQMDSIYKGIAVKTGCYDTDGFNVFKFGKVYLKDELANGKYEIQVYPDSCKIKNGKHYVVENTCNKLSGRSASDLLYGVDNDEVQCWDGACVKGACQNPTCSDGIKNQGEKDIDCGGPCNSCKTEVNLCISITNKKCYDYCDGYTYYYQGSCVPETGECKYDLSEKNSKQCGFNPVCLKDSDCGSTVELNSFQCLNTFLLQDVEKNICLYPGTENAKCEKVKDTKISKKCEYACEEGVCVEENPEVFCIDTDDPDKTIPVQEQIYEEGKINFNDGSGSGTQTVYDECGIYFKHLDTGNTAKVLTNCTNNKEIDLQNTGSLPLDQYEYVYCGIREEFCPADPEDAGGLIGASQIHECEYGCSDDACNKEPDVNNYEIECYAKSDCGQTTSLNSFQCLNKFLIEDVINYYCINPGTVESYCVQEQSTKINTKCEFGCEEGSCNEPLTCSDGIKNQEEEDIDCGGPNCDACIHETCFDGIKNQDEEKIDCGGVCGSCDICEPNVEFLGKSSYWGGREGIFGFSSNSVFVTSHNKVLYYDGNSLEPLPIELSQSDINDAQSSTGNLPAFSPEAIWGNAVDNVYAVGSRGTLVPETAGGNVISVIYHYDGISFKKVYDDQKLGCSFNDVWGSSEDDVYVLDGCQKVLHFDGSTWQEIKITGNANLDLHGSSADNVYAVGWSDIDKYDGNSWTKVDEALYNTDGLDIAFDAVWALADDSVFFGTQESWGKKEDGKIF